ncbi:MAG: murein biosynthesis integral membrane protein MurJ [Phycisphaerales bacterium]|jgi:putative peptidoglycan lipid II flippase
MVKGFRQIAILTVASRILGLIRDMAFAFFLGAGGIFDGWAIAFKIPNLARRIFGEGAAAASFIPVYSQELQQNPKQANKLAYTIVTVIFLLLAIITIIGEGVIWGYYTFFSKYPSTDLKLSLAGIMLPYMILICVVAILAGILQTHRHFAAPAAAPIILNIFIIGSLCFSGWVLSIRPERLVFIVAVAVIIAGFVQLSTQIIPLRNRGIHIRPTWEIHSEAFKKIIFMMGPMILGLTVTQINTLADDLIAVWFSGSAEKGEFFIWLGRQIKYPLWDGAVSQLYYSQRLYQFPLGVLGISLATAIFPVMSSDAAKKDMVALRQTISRGLRGTIFIAIPAAAGLILVKQPLIKLLFERGQFSSSDTMMTAAVLSFYAIGLCGFFLQQIVTRAFYSIQDSKMPARTALLAVVVNIILNLTLIWFMGAPGLALSTSVCSYLQVVILVALLDRRFEGPITRGLFTTIIKTAIATAIMYAIASLVLKATEQMPAGLKFEIARIIAVVLSAVLVYAAAAKALRIEMLGLLTGQK